MYSNLKTFVPAIGYAPNIMLIVIVLLVLVLPAPDSQGFIITADYGHTPSLIPIVTMEKCINYNSTIMVTQLLIIHEQNWPDQQFKVFLP